MSGQRVGYTRVSSLDQNADRQLDGVALTGCSPTAPRAEAVTCSGTWRGSRSAIWPAREGSDHVRNRNLQRDAAFPHPTSLVTRDQLAAY